MTNITRLNAATDIRRERRLFPLDQFHSLIEATMSNGQRFEMRGAGRAKLYLFAVDAELRAVELASLTMESLPDRDGRGLVFDFHAL